MNGITQDNIHDFTVTKSSRRRLQSSNDINAAYTISIKNAALSYTELANQLVSSVNSGKFTTNLQSYAAANGVSVLATATSSNIDTVDQSPSSSGNNNDSGNSSHWSVPNIAGVAIGSFFGVLIIIGFVYYFMFRYKKFDNADQPHTKTDIESIYVEVDYGLTYGKEDEFYSTCKSM